MASTFAVSDHHTRRLERQAERTALLSWNNSARRQAQMIGQSRVMQRVMSLIDQVASTAASVVIIGQSGTGKEVAARTIHQLSPRRNQRYVAVNCAAMPETLMESELFGHERGAFTGADRLREGWFELANGGTLLLDEIGEMKPELQVKLLRVLEEGKLRRLGGSAEIATDVRVLAATNCNLQTAVQQRRFREDLYYRLNVFTIELPALCERREDIPDLIDYFLQELEPPNGKTITGLDAECLKLLTSYQWPGNIRQLRNVIERALIVTRGPLLTVADLPEELMVTLACDSLRFELRPGMSLEEAEYELIMCTVKFTGGNKSRAAELLGICLKTLYNRLEAYQSKNRAISQ
jgi:DNA-binding NtrC family response regulator